jgi:hypothetical protein
MASRVRLPLVTAVTSNEVVAGILEQILGGAADRQPSGAHRRGVIVSLS